MNQAYSATSAYFAASKMVTSLGAVVMLYDGMIQAVSAAKTAIEDGRIEDRFRATQKACKILLGLQSSLDFDRGGDVSLMLDQFYHTLYRDIQDINFKNSAAACDEVVEALMPVRKSWIDLVDQEKRGEITSGKEPAPRAATPQAAYARAPQPQASGGNASQDRNPDTVKISV